MTHVTGFWCQLAGTRNWYRKPVNVSWTSGRRSATAHNKITIDVRVRVSFYSAPQCWHCKRCISYGNSVCPSVCLSATTESVLSALSDIEINRVSAGTRKVNRVSVITESVITKFY